MFTRMKAEYKQSHNKKMNVTLKILKLNEVENRLVEFMQLADKWAKLDLSEIVKLHGLTLCQPIAMVLESIPYGPLDEFLKNPQNKIKTVCLVETAYSLAKALHYLQDNQIMHGKIRCSSLQVTHFEAPGNLIVKLGDPGLPTHYNMNE